MAEQLAFEDALASPPVLTVTRGRVERSETECSVCATQPLAGAVFAGNQHVGIRRADARNHIQDRPHNRPIARSTVGNARRAGSGFLLEPLPFGQRAPQLDLSP